MDRNERNGLKPTPRDAHRPDTPPRAWPADLPSDRAPARSASAFRTPLLLRDPTCFTAFSRREALILLAGLLLLATPWAAALAEPLEEDAPLRRLEARLAEDPRLDQKISLTAWAEPLEDILARLSRDTGVQLIFDGRDIGDQRVNLLLKDQPLRRVQVLLAETLDLYWLRDRKAPRYRYTLFQDSRSRKAEQELLSRARDDFEEGIRRMVDSLKLTPPEIEKLQERAPRWASDLSAPRWRLAIRLLGEMAPSRLKGVAEGADLQIVSDSFLYYWLEHNSRLPDPSALRDSRS